MSKRLVVCCDGTWNTPDQRSAGKLSSTNVTKVALAVAPEDGRGREQRTFYHRGVGTSRRERIRGGAFGAGLSRDICDTYRFLVRNFEPGDELFFFGFSRGAFTARSTAGFVRNCGILRPSEIDRVDEAYALYRSRRSTTHPRSVESTLFRQSYSHETRIRFIGVWDTVGALGIPFDGVRLVNLLNRRWQFHDASLSAIVDSAFQALAIDEKRGPFRPSLWTQESASRTGPRVEQVWFPGVHCDVGGGYPDHGVSDIPLLWMVDRAQRCGLAFDPEAFMRQSGADGSSCADDATVRSRTYVDPDPLADIHESRKGFYRLIPSCPRPLGVGTGSRESVASTAVQRYRDSVAYAPPGLLTYLDGKPEIVDVDYGRTGTGASVRHKTAYALGSGPLQ